jgi:4-amino-4-deoxy-L-arabinose transferase-like glycosyltransferase
MSATVTSASGTPTGTVSFLNNGAAIGSATLTNGVATYTASSLPAGTYPITAQYAGTSSFNLSTSSTVQWTVEASGVTLSLNTSTLKVPLGVSASNNVTLTLTPFGGYSGELQMACKSPTAGTTCTFQPQTVNISQNSGPSNVNVTIKTSSNVSSADPHNRQPFASTRSLVLSASFLWFPGILAAAFVGLKRRQLLPRSGRLLLLLVLCCMFGAVTGCGSGAMDPLASPTVTALQLVVSGAGNVNQSITLNVTTTQ